MYVCTCSFPAAGSVVTVGASPCETPSGQGSCNENIGFHSGNVMHTHAHTYIQTHVHARTHMHTYTHTHLHTHKHAFTHTNILAYMHSHLSHCVRGTDSIQTYANRECACAQRSGAAARESPRRGCPVGLTCHAFGCASPFRARTLWSQLPKTHTVCMCVYACSYN